MAGKILMPEHFELPLMQLLHDQERTWKRGILKHDRILNQLGEFMAEIFPDEGLDLVLGQWPKNTTRITAHSLCLFTSQTASTTITSGQTVSAITETTYTSYARQSLATATWGAAAAGTGGRKTTYSQITFPTLGSAATLNGIFIGWDTGAGGVATPTICVGQANFDDVTAIAGQINDIVKVTPTVQFNN
jgi:hypothetical protein